MLIIGRFHRHFGIFGVDNSAINMVLIPVARMCGFIRIPNVGIVPGALVNSC